MSLDVEVESEYVNTKARLTKTPTFRSVRLLRDSAERRAVRCGARRTRPERETGVVTGVVSDAVRRFPPNSSSPFGTMLRACPRRLLCSRSNTGLPSHVRVAEDPAPLGLGVEFCSSMASNAVSADTSLRLP